MYTHVYISFWPPLSKELQYCAALRACILARAASMTEAENIKHSLEASVYVYVCVVCVQMYRRVVCVCKYMHVLVFPYACALMHVNAHS
jgi:hypothetical protein